MLEKSLEMFELSTSVYVLEIQGLEST